MIGRRKKEMPELDWSPQLGGLELNEVQRKEGRRGGGIEEEGAVL